MCNCTYFRNKQTGIQRFLLNFLRPVSLGKGTQEQIKDFRSHIHVISVTGRRQSLLSITLKLHLGRKE